jgi:hypothetical protein
MEIYILKNNNMKSPWYVFRSETCYKAIKHFSSITTLKFKNTFLFVLFY